jgi:hypothetical protein
MPAAKINKSEMVRDMLTKNPDMTARDIVEAMAAKKQKVTANLVYTLRGKMNGKKGRKVHRRAASVRNHSSADPVSLFVRVKELASEVGGFGKLKELAEAMAE